MKASLTIVILSLFVFSCGKKSDCSSNNTGSVMIHNDGDFMPSGTADFYLGTTKIASVAKGAEVTVDNISVGPFIVTVKIGADTIYIDEFLPDTVKQCQELHYSTDRFLPVSDKRLKKNIVPLNNILVVLGTTLGTWLLFGERVSRLNLLGMLLASAAIMLVVRGGYVGKIVTI